MEKTLQERFDEIKPSEQNLEAAGFMLRPLRGRYRIDDARQFHFARQLEFVEAQSRDIIYSGMKAAQYVPVKIIPRGADESTYYQYEGFGEARIVGPNVTDDLPTAGVVGGRFPVRIEEIAGQYVWSLRDIERAAFAGTPYTAQLASAAQRMIAAKIDKAMIRGMTEVGGTGFANNAGPTVTTLPNAANWNTLDGAQMLENLYHMAERAMTPSDSHFIPDTFAFPPQVLHEIRTTSVSPIEGNTDTVYKVFRENLPEFTLVGALPGLQGIGVGGTDRIVCYNRQPDVLGYPVAVEFESLPPQAVNVGFRTPVRALVATSVQIHYPIAISYADTDIT